MPTGTSLNGAKVGAGAAGAAFVAAGADFVPALGAAFAGALAGALDAAGMVRTWPALRSALSARPLAFARSARVTFSLSATVMRVSPLTMVRLPPGPTAPTGVSLVGTGAGSEATGTRPPGAGAEATEPAGRAPPE